VSLPTWIHTHLNTREPLTPVAGERVDNWNVAHWTQFGLHILTGAHDRNIAEQRAAEYTEIPGVIVVPGNPQSNGGQQ
jgi:hypothetical protein